MRKIRRSDLLAGCVLLVAAVIVLWRPLLRGEVFLPLDLLAHMPPWRYSYERTVINNPITSDLVLEYYPRRLLATQMLRAGQLPLWNPNIMSGMPLLADGYSALLYPLSFLFVVLPVAQAFGWYAFVHLALAGLGAYWFARGLGLRPLPALVGGLTYMGCGFTMTWLAFPEFSAVIGWLPVALGCAERYEQAAIAGRGWRAGLGYGCATAVALAFCVLCQLQLAVYAGVAVAFYWLVRRLLLVPRRIARAFGALAGVAGLAVLLSAIQWLPTLELALGSQRRGAAEQITQTLGVPGLLRFVAPAVFGRPRAVPGWGPPTLDALFPYVGILPLLLALVGAWWARTVQAVTLLLLAVTTLALSSLPSELLRRLPLLDQLPAVYRWTMVLSLALALLAAYGLEWLLAAPSDADQWSRRLRLTSRVVCAAAGFGLLGLTLQHLQLLTPGSRYGEYITLLRPQMQAVPLTVGLASGVLIAAAFLIRISGDRRRSRARTRSKPSTDRNTRVPLGVRIAWLHLIRASVSYPWTAYLLGVPAVLLIGLDLAWYGLPLQSSADPRRLFEPTTDLVAAIGGDTLQADLTTDVVYPPTRTSTFLSQDTDLYRVLGADYPSLQPNTFSVFGVQDVRGYASLFSADYLRFARRWEGKQGDEAGWAQIYLTQAYNTPALLDLMGVRYILFNPGSENETQYPGLELVIRDDEGAIYRNSNALSRAFLVHTAEVLPGDEAVLERLTSPGFPVSTTALLTEAAPELAAAGADEQVSVVNYAPNEVDVDVQASAPGLLVLSDTLYSGWETFLDGRKVHTYRVNTILRGVAIPPGAHRVEFRYRPWSFTVGATLTLVGLVGLVCAIFLVRRGARLR